MNDDDFQQLVEHLGHCLQQAQREAETGVLAQGRMREFDVCRQVRWQGPMHDSITGSRWERAIFVDGPQYVTLSRRGHGGTLRVSRHWRDSDSAGVV